jgi:hypothetical protein
MSDDDIIAVAQIVRAMEELLHRYVNDVDTVERLLRESGPRTALDFIDRKTGDLRARIRQANAEQLLHDVGWSSGEDEDGG